MTDPIVTTTANAVMDAMYKENMDFRGENSALARAAILTLADQLVPESEPPQRDDFSDRSVWQWAVDCYNQDKNTRAKFLAIAAMLDSSTSTYGDH